MTETPASPLAITRRTMLAGAAAVGVTTALVACSAEGNGSTGTGTQADAPATVKAAQVPVGGAAIVGDVVVSQPTAGSFKAFSAVCTHQGCLVSAVRGTQVLCACHGSVFSATDGSVINGPANRALSARTVTVSGDSLSIS
jgi:Rieske Fe-S protein